MDLIERSLERYERQNHESELEEVMICQVVTELIAVGVIEREQEESDDDYFQRIYQMVKTDPMKYMPSPDFWEEQ